jgi:hypothetical protein
MCQENIPPSIFVRFYRLRFFGLLVDFFFAAAFGFGFDFDFDVDFDIDDPSTRAIVSPISAGL